MAGRITVALVTTATASALLVASQGAVEAIPTDRHEPPAARAGLRCQTGVVGFDSEHHLRYDQFTNGRLVKSDRTATPLPVEVTAWGHFSNHGSRKRSRLALNAITTDGVPRRIKLTLTQSSVRARVVRKYQQRSFTPELFADSYTYFAYTVRGRTLKRWALTRYRDGDVRFASPVVVGRLPEELTSLQATLSATVHRRASEILYGTTSSGELYQIVVPFREPRRARLHRLAASGYEGVTELSWTLCNRQGTVHSLIAIDPVGNRATWTTIRRALTRPKSNLRGDVVGVSDWALSAVY